jgi:hypothetical protein
MSVVGVIGVAGFFANVFAMFGCVGYGVFQIIMGHPRLGLRLLLTYFAFCGFGVVGILSFILAITIGEVPYNTH